MEETPHRRRAFERAMKKIRGVERRERKLEILMDKKYRKQMRAMARQKAGNQDPTPDDTTRKRKTSSASDDTSTKN